MKKTLLFMVLSIACIMTHAQKADSTLLYGKWYVYSFTTMEQVMCRDSMDRNMKALKQILKGMDAKKGFTAADSVDMVLMINGFFKTYMTFDKEGRTTEQAGGNQKELIESPIETGTYEWSGENKISLHMESKTVTITILKLTATKLVIMSDGEKDGGMTFTKAK
jgi:hypothetical protein